MLTEQNGIQVDKFYPPVDWQYSFPEGYTRLEYLESTGTQYIDTEYTPNYQTKMDIEFGDISASWICGSKKSSSTAVNFGISYHNACFGTSVLGFSNLSSGKHIINYGQTLIVDGTTIGTFPETTETTTVSLALFGIKNENNSVTALINGKIYYCQIYDNETLVRNFIPVKRNSDNKPGMYDLINNVFYVNAASSGDDFVMGPELYSNNSQIDIRQKNNTNFVEKYKFNENNELVWANPQLNLSGPVNYSVVGNPTITDNVVSGFSESDYLTLPLFVDDNIQNYEFYTEVVVGETATTYMGILTYRTSNVGGILITSSNKVAWRVARYIGTTIDFQIGSDITLSQGDNVKVKCYYKGNNTFSLNISVNNGNWIEYTGTPENEISPLVLTNYYATIGRSYYQSSSLWIFNGSIDLKETYIKVNDKLWFYGKNYTSENYAPVPAGLNYNNTTTPSIGYVDMRTQVFTPAPTDGIKYSQTRDLKVIPPEDNTITLLYGTDEIHYLPSEYRELKGVNFTGSQSIDTGFKPNQNTRVLIKFNINGGYANQGILGCDYFRLSRNGSTSLSDIYGTQNNNLTSFSTNKDYVIDKNKNKTIINNSVFSTYTEETFQANENLVIGTYGGNWFYGCLYYCKVWDNGTLIKEFIPCERKSDNVTGMYDTVQGVFYEVNSTFVELKYKLFGLLAQVSSGTYDVYIDDILYATTASGTQTDIDFSQLGPEYVSIGTATTPEDLVLHKIVIKPNTSGETLTTFRCRRHSSLSSGIYQQGNLWCHFELKNTIDIRLAFCGESVYRNTILYAVTTQNNKLTYATSSSSTSGIYSIFGSCEQLVYLPVLESSNKNYTGGVYLTFTNVPAKRIIIKNNGSFNMGIFRLCQAEKVEIENSVRLHSGAASANNANIATNLKLLPKTIKDDTTTTLLMREYNSLYPTKIDDSLSINREFLDIAGTLTYPARGLRGLKVSNEAPFDGTAPQINVSYTGLDRDALVELFESMPYNVGYTEVGTPTITDGVLIAPTDKENTICTSQALNVGDGSFEMQFCLLNPTIKGCGLFRVNDNSGTRCTFSQNNTFNLYPDYQTDSSVVLRALGNFWNTAVNNSASKVYLKIQCTGKDSNNEYPFIFSGSLDGITWRTQTEISSIPLASGIIQYCSTYQSYAVGSSVGYDLDLNETYIKIKENNEWIPWFTGKAAITKQINITAATGNNLTKVGTGVTIDENGVASGFSHTSYFSIQSGSQPKFVDKKATYFFFKVRTPSQVTTHNFILGYNHSVEPTSAILYDGGLYLNTSLRLELHTIVTTTAPSFSNIELDTDYYIEFKYIEDKDVFRFGISKDNINWTYNEYTPANRNGWYIRGTTIRLGDAITSADAHFDGKIYLPETKIDFDGYNHLVKGYLTDSDRAIATGKGWDITG